MFRGEKIKKEEVKIKTQNKKIVETDMDYMVLYIQKKKQLLVLGRNSAM